MKNKGFYEGYFGKQAEDYSFREDVGEALAENVKKLRSGVGEHLGKVLHGANPIGLYRDIRGAQKAPGRVRDEARRRAEETEDRMGKIISYLKSPAAQTQTKEELESMRAYLESLRESLPYYQRMSGKREGEHHPFR